MRPCVPPYALRCNRANHSDSLRRQMAIHEAGHAVVARALKIGLQVDLTIDDAEGGDSRSRDFDSDPDPADSGTLSHDFRCEIGDSRLRGRDSSFQIRVARRPRRDSDARPPPAGLSCFGFAEEPPLAIARGDARLLLVALARHVIDALAGLDTDATSMRVKPCRLPS